MTANKKNHYVPRFYLKRFSEDGKRINLYNISKRNNILDASLRNQCYGDFFYGKDPTIEKTLSASEGDIARTFRQIDAKLEMPEEGSNDHIGLLFYILSQYSRTRTAAERVNEMVDKTSKYRLSCHPDTKEMDLDDFMIRISEPASLSLGVAMQLLPFLFDLRQVMVINDTPEELITSDNPVVFYNQLFSFSKSGSNCGVASKGLQIIFPLDPKKLVILYDPVIYHLGLTVNTLVHTRSIDDIRELNNLQMCSANENVYFRNRSVDTAILYRKCSPFRHTDKVNVKVYPQNGMGGKNMEILRTTTEDVRTNLDLSFVRIKRTARRWRSQFRKLKRRPAVVVRDKEVCDAHDFFMNKINTGRRDPNQFVSFFGSQYERRWDRKKLLG